MWILCLAKDSHEISSLIFSEKQWKNKKSSYECRPLQLWLALQGLTSIKNILIYTVDSRYLEVKGTLWNTSRYPYFNISDLQNWGKCQSNNKISQMNMQSDSFS